MTVGSSDPSPPRATAASGTVWLISPVYFDCEPYLILRERIKELHRRDGLSAYRLRFVAVDDSAGADPAIDVLRQLDDVEVITTPFNLGHQRAIVYGLRRLLPRVGDDDALVSLDADGEDRPEDVPRLLERLRAGSGAERQIVVARRTERREALPFKVLYLVFMLMFRVLTGTTMRSGNYAAYSGATARQILRHPYFELCYSSTLIALELPTAFVPCARSTRYAGQSRMSYSKLVIHAFRMLMPFIDQIAVRGLIAFSVVFTLSAVLTLAVLVAVIVGAHISSWVAAALIGSMAISMLSAANAIVLFSVFSQSRGISLSDLESDDDGGP